MKVTRKHKDKVYEYDYPEKYYFRSIKFKSSDQVKQFSSICRENDSNLRKELNLAMDFTISSGVLISDVLQKFKEGKQ